MENHKRASITTIKFQKKRIFQKKEYQNFALDFDMFI